MNLRSGRMLLPPSIPQPVDWPTIDCMMDRVEYVETADDAKNYIRSNMGENIRSSVYEKRMVTLSSIELIRRFNLDTHHKVWVNLYQRFLSQIENVPHLAYYYSSW